MTENGYSSNVQYCQTLNTSLLWVDHWTRIIFLIFRGFGKTSKSKDFRKILCSIVLLISHKYLGILELNLWNRHRNVENFTRNIIVMNGSTGDEPKPLKIKNMILVQWSTHNKEVLKVWQYWTLEEYPFSVIIISSFASSNICWLSNFSSSENWLNLPDPQSILSSSNSLFYYLRLAYPL